MKNLKKAIAAAVLSAMIILPAAAYAEGINVILNGDTLNCDIAPVLDDGVMLIQAKPVLERLGFSVGWNDDEKKLTACTSTDMFEARIGDKKVLVNGQEYEFETAPVIIMNRAFVSEEFLQKMFGLTTVWDPAAMTEYLSTFDYDENSAPYEENAEEAIVQPDETKTAPKDFDSLYSRFRNIATREDQSKAFDIMMEVDISKLQSMANDTEAIKAYLEETLSPQMYGDAMNLYEKYKDAI